MAASSYYTTLHYTTLFNKKIRVATKITVLPSETLSQTPDLENLSRGISIVETCYQLSSKKMDTQSVINWTVVD